MTITELLLNGFAKRMANRVATAVSTSGTSTHFPCAGFLPSTSSFTTMTTSVPAAPNLVDIFKQKKTLRFNVKKKLKAMDLTLRSQEDDEIQRVVLNSPWFKSSKRLCAYISCGALREVDTSKLLSEILENSGGEDQSQGRKTLYVPRVEDKNRHMRMLKIFKMDDLISNSMNILEPASFDAEGNERKDVMFSREPVDVFLLPGLAFDKSGRRLGRGGGYYDTFLTKYLELADRCNWKKPFLVALAYSSQILEDGVIPITPNDVFVDALVSYSGVFPITPAAREICS